MKNVFILLLVLGAVFAGWWNREEIVARFNPPAAQETTDVNIEVAPNTKGPPAAPTPHPAKESRLAAANAYPALGIPNSAFNKKFLALYTEAQLSDPQLLSQANWPIKLAERTAVALGGGPMPIATPTPRVQPKGLQGSALDQRPK